jgi:TolA-binding protein
MTSLVLTTKQLTAAAALMCSVAASGYVDMVKRFDEVNSTLASINTQNTIAAQMITRLEQQSAANSKHIAELDLMINELQIKAKCRKGNC